ncbi:DUF6157 family protein [Methylobacterium oxalidis]|uniref:DUF6157 family protein n=1 Tax=Methylobacterium oxalidis TaxID=944322 RepID=UPI003314886F
MSTNYADTFIVASADCTAERGLVPGRAGSVAQIQHALLLADPYGLTSDDLLFEVHVRRRGLAEAERAAERAAFFGRPQACLRASPLVKRYGWGLHHDAAGRVAAYGVETEIYRTLAARGDLRIVPGMRSRRT